MLSYTRRAVSTVELVVGFDHDDSVRTLQFDFEAALKSLFDGISSAFPPPGAVPPGQPIPYWMLSGQSKYFVATSQSFSAVLNFVAGMPQGGVISVIEKYARKLDEVISTPTRKIKVLFSGIIVTMNFRHDGNEEDIATDIGNMFFKARSSVQHLVNASYSAGYLGVGSADWANVFYTANIYKTLNLTLPANPLVQQVLPDLTKITPAEMGLAIRVDVNDRPQVRNAAASKATRGKISALVPVIQEACTSKLDELVGEELKVPGL